MSDEQPTRAGDAPVAMDLEEGNAYYWCACGRSSNQPLCDGSHSGSSFVPFNFTPDKAGEAYLCLCKKTKNPPYCDGSHSSS